MRKLLASDPVDSAGPAPAPPSQTAVAPQEKPPKLRSSAHRSRYRFVRRCPGVGTGAYQSRIWIGGIIGSLNLGLFTFDEHGEHCEWMAGRLSREYVKRARPGKTIPEVVAELKAAGLAPQTLQPPWVTARADGTFEARTKSRKPGVLLTGFATAAAAYEAMLKVLTALAAPRVNRRARAHKP